jgi:hypothetical protein
MLMTGRLLKGATEQILIIDFLSRACATLAYKFDRVI